MEKREYNFLRRRGLLTEQGDEQLDIDFSDVVDNYGNLRIDALCRNKGGVYCMLTKLIDDVPHRSEEIVKSVSTIYSFLRPKIYDNRVKFHSLINAVLTDSSMPANTLKLIADYIMDDQSYDSHYKVSVLNKLRREDTDMSQKEIERFIAQASHSKYTQYENSFKGQHFKVVRTKLQLNYRNTLDVTMVELIKSIIKRQRGGDGRTMDEAIKTLMRAIKKEYKPERMLKADLECISTIYDEEGFKVIPEGSFVEVKKLDYLGDSYLSEFFAIYKRTDTPKGTKTAQFELIYNKLIDRLYMEMSKSVFGEKLLIDIKSNFAGIIYDENIFVPKKDIELYWSNKGRASCKQKRLSIRYRVKSVVNLYSYDKGKDVMTLERNKRVKPSEKIFC